MNSLWDKLPPELRDNPFFHFSEKTHYVPAWDKIRAEHVEPAFDYIHAKLEADVAAIAAERKKPTFKNTVEAFEEAFSMSGYFFSVFGSMMAKTDEEQAQFDELEKRVWSKYEDTYNRIFSDNKIYQRFKDFAVVYPTLELTQEKKYLFEMNMEAFLDNGGKFKRERRETLFRLGKEISALSFEVQKNMREAEKETVLIIQDPKELKGLPDFLIKNAEAEAKKRGLEGQWVFGTGREIAEPFMQSAADRDVRKRMWKTFYSIATTGEHDNRQAIIDLISLEHKAARVMGYQSAASLKLKYNMAADTQTVEKFLSTVRAAAKTTAAKELAALSEFARRTDGVKKLDAWDIDYYSERLKELLLGYDEEAIRPYFELEHTLAKCSGHFEKLLGISIKESKAEYPKYHEDVRFFDVTDVKTGKHMGLIGMDLYAREGKGAGIAWNVNILGQGKFEGKNRRPFDMIVTKFVKGQNGAPTLIGHYGTVILFHELGHAVHNMVSKCQYQSMSGTSVVSDFVEFPSQIQEEWVYEPEVLDTIARHYQLGSRLPIEVRDNISVSRKFMSGIEALRRAERGWLDLSLYKKKPENIRDLRSFENSVLSRYRLPGIQSPVISPNFSYTLGGGYEASFYSYQWTDRMGKDFFAKFRKEGLYDKALSQAFRKALEKGSSRDESAIFRDVMHRNPLNKAFLQAKGLTPESRFDYTLPPSVNDNMGPKLKVS